MKYIIFIFLLQIFTPTFSQTESFTVENNYITWTKEFKSDMDEAAILSKLKRHPILREVHGSAGKTDFTSVECKGVAIYLQSRWQGYMMFDKTNEGYKITFDSIVLEPSTTMSMGGVSTTNNLERIEDYLLRNRDNTIRQNSQAQEDLECLDQTLTAIFKVE